MGFANKKPANISVPSIEQLKGFVPLNSLDSERLSELAQHARIITYQKNVRIFNHGDSDNRIIYLLSGSVMLRNADEQHKITAGESDTSLPLDSHVPRHYSATALSEVSVIYVERNLLDILLTWDPYAGYQVNEIDEIENYFDPTDWMGTILRSQVFQKIPPIKIQVMFQKLETVPVKTEQIIFSQGDEGDYFYLIKSGRCLVIRDTGYDKDMQIELVAGDSFGEEALLSNSPRNASIKMLCDGTLLRLKKEDFHDLFLEPVIESLDFAQAEALHAHGANWVDVRQAEEYNNSFIPESINIPLNRIRESLHLIPKNEPCIVFCDNGHRSTCATYLLNAYGYEAYVLDGGIEKLNELLI